MTLLREKIGGKIMKDRLIFKNMMDYSFDFPCEAICSLSIDIQEGNPSSSVFRKKRDTKITMSFSGGGYFESEISEESAESIYLGYREYKKSIEGIKNEKY